MSATVDLNHIGMLLRVVQAGSFAAAARALNVPTSTVSRRVANLEAALGARLLVRGTRHVSLTDAGSTYYERISRGLSVIEEANAVVSDADALPSGRVRVRAPRDLGSEQLAALSTRFTAQNAGIVVEVHLSARGFDRPLEGYDIILQSGTVDDQDVVVRSLGFTELHLFAAVEYIERQGSPRSLSALAKRPFVHLRSAREESAIELFGPRGLEKVRLGGTVVGDEYTFVRGAVRAGAGIGLLPVALCRDDSSLQRVLPKYSARGRSLVMITPPLNRMPQRALLLRAFLLENLAMIPDCGPGPTT